MFKVIFVLVMSTYHGGINTDLHFSTMNQCEAAKNQIRENSIRGHFSGMTCVEMQVPIKKTKCKISNEYARVTGNYYPVTLECEEK